MGVPESYFTNYDRLCEYLKGIEVGEVEEIGRSPGRRPLQAVCYGEFEPIEKRANLSAALSAGDPEAFFGSGRDKQALVIAAAVHGAEMESISGVMNLITHRTGALPLLFEGGSGKRYEGANVHRQIVETYMVLFETVCEIGVEEGFKG